MIRITPVNPHDEQALDFIERVYTESFPMDERRDFDEVVRLLRENDDFAIVLLRDEETPVGFISYWPWSDFTSGTLCHRQSLPGGWLWSHGHDRAVETDRKTGCTRSGETRRRPEPATHRLLSATGVCLVAPALYPTALLARPASARTETHVIRGD